MNTTIKISILVVIFSVGIVYLYYITKKVHNFAPAVHKSETISGKLRYRYFTPEVKANEKYPLVIYLHGGGSRGKNNRSQLEEIARNLASDSIQEKYPSFVIAPQCPHDKQFLDIHYKQYPIAFHSQDEVPESIETKLIVDLIKEFSQKYPIDTTRIYVCGFSMGASGSWDIITRYPNLFSAAFMIAGSKDTTKVEKVKHLPIWFFHGKHDNICTSETSEKTHEALVKINGNSKLTVFDAGHGCIKETLNTPGLYEWLFAQKK
ncbi:MAG: dienelactone hydrolase family protein [Bacteroidales bacterium]|nr:dienelactone hydrolase family protein [Bacteroidales bacterium]